PVRSANTTKALSKDDAFFVSANYEITIQTPSFPSPLLSKTLLTSSRLTHQYPCNRSSFINVLKIKQTIKTFQIFGSRLQNFI
ncbi:hypothetical protein, partial [Aliivibrio logei]|uniref:hypothetical protein n=1 Tax=Aliivibrio logei TaxID=688 RepID=UPI001A7E1623